MKKHNKGFTLIEVILITVIIAIVTAAILGMYSKITKDHRITEQAKLISLTFNNLNGYLISMPHDGATGVAEITAAINPPTPLISAGLIPTKMVASATTMKTIWGGSVTFTGVALDVVNDGITLADVRSYEMILNDIPQEYCVRLASHPSIVNSSQRITVNGTVIKNPGISTVNISNLTTACVNANNVIRIANNPFKGVAIERVATASTGFRPKENKYNIAPIGLGTTTTGTPTCTGTATWNASIGSCVCPATNIWNGTTCIAPSATATQCRIGSFWNRVTQTCQNLCAANQRVNPVTRVCEAAPNPNVTLCIPGLNPSNAATPSATICTTAPSRVSATPIYEGGRDIPNTVLAATSPAFASIATTTTHTAQVASSMPTTNSLAGTTACPTGARPTFALAPNNANAGTFNNPQANFDGKTCQMCISGEWNGDRCVTK